MAQDKPINIQLVYAEAQQQTLLSLSVNAGQTIEQAIRHSGILDLHPDIDLATNKVGIFSEVCALDTPLHEGDRIEIYRELLIDPMEARRRRATK